MALPRQVQKVIEMPENDKLPLLEASRRGAAIPPTPTDLSGRSPRCRVLTLEPIAQVMQRRHLEEGPTGDLLRVPRQPRAAGDVRGGEEHAQNRDSLLSRLRGGGARSVVFWMAV